MLNHDDEANTTYGYDKAPNSFFIDAAVDIQAGQELTMKYSEM